MRPAVVRAAQIVACIKDCGVSIPDDGHIAFKPDGIDPMYNALALNDAPASFSATSLDPYGQLVKMLLPRAQSIVIYDRMGVPIWVSEGLDESALHDLVKEALAAE